MEWGGRDAGREREFTQDEEVRKAEDGRLSHREGGKDAWIGGEVAGGVTYWPDLSGWLVLASLFLLALAFVFHCD